MLTMSVSASTPYDIRTATVIGVGDIGALWAALFLVYRLSVCITDPAPHVEKRVADH